MASFFHIQLQECGIELNALVTTQIPHDVFRSSLQTEKNTETPPSHMKDKRALAMDSLCSFANTSQKKLCIYEERTQLMRENAAWEQESYKIKIRSEIISQIGTLVEKLRDCNKEIRALKKNTVKGKEKKEHEEDIRLVTQNKEMYATEILALRNRLG